MLIEGATNCTFTYIPSHLYYCLFELLKNSLRAVCETHGVKGHLPPIKERPVYTSVWGGARAREPVCAVWW